MGPWSHLRETAGTKGLKPGASQKIRTLWFAGVSAVRIAVLLDIPEHTILAEARRLDLPCRSPRRRCFDCGASSLEATFPGRAKPRRKRDRCEACAADPLGEAMAERRAEIARMRLAGKYRAPKPIHSTPLFAWLRATDTAENCEQAKAATGDD
jgi:hypothetical protein